MVDLSGPEIAKKKFWSIWICLGGSLHRLVQQGGEKTINPINFFVGLVRDLTLFHFNNGILVLCVRVNVYMFC